MSGVRMIQDNTVTCLRNLERSLSRCQTFLQHRCIPRECALATKVPHPAPWVNLTLLQGAAAAHANMQCPICCRQWLPAQGALVS